MEMKDEEDYTLARLAVNTTTGHRIGTRVGGSTSSQGTSSGHLFSSPATPFFCILPPAVPPVASRQRELRPSPALNSTSSSSSSSTRRATAMVSSESGSASSSSSTARKGKKKAWTMTLELVREEVDGSQSRSSSRRTAKEEEEDDDGYYQVKGVVVDSVERPLTKDIISGPDEGQDTGGQPGWWFLLVSRNYRSLPSLPRKMPFPSTGKRRLTVDLWYGKNKIVTTHGFFNFDYKPLPPNAKIHVDWKHRHPQLSSSESSSQTNTPSSTDFLFLRTTGEYLTAVRLFVPYSVLNANNHLLDGWLTPKRARKMFQQADDAEDDFDSYEHKAKRPRRDDSSSTSRSKDYSQVRRNSSSSTSSSARRTSRSRHTDPEPEEIYVNVDDDDEDDDDDDEYDFDLHDKKTTRADYDEPATSSSTRRAGATKRGTAASTGKASSSGNRNTRTSRTSGSTSNPTTGRTKSKSRDVVENGGGSLWRDQPLLDDRANGTTTTATATTRGRGRLRKGGTTSQVKEAKIWDDNEEEEEQLEEEDGASSTSLLGSEFSLLELEAAEQRNQQHDGGEDVQLESAQAKDIFVYNSQSQGSEAAFGPGVEEINYSLIQVQEPKCIGSGSFAQVYRAKYGGRDIAIKVFKPNETATRIDNEIRILGKLRGHTNVVHVVGYSVVNDQKRIAMEFCALGNLHDCIHSIKKQSCRRSSRVTTRRKTEKGLAFEASVRSSRRSRGGSASTSKRKRGDEDTVEDETEEDDPYQELRKRRASIIVGIAEGVLVDANWVPKIADFGLSTVDTLKMIGMGVGTSRWRAPEVYKNKPTKVKNQFKSFYTNSSDVYSFGVIVWELFHLGHLPWEGELDDDMRRKVMQGERPKIDRDVPPLWRKLIETCWAQDPERRPSFDNVVRYIYAHKLAP